ncbi:MAG: PEP-CTERM sorting domain-containing protein [Symploca sp. SIO2E6]|nr:PEP-CTERM sorting domain-containing protein [Symploca sp. SIO2E6]
MLKKLALDAKFITDTTAVGLPVQRGENNLLVNKDEKASLLPPVPLLGGVRGGFYLRFPSWEGLGVGSAFCLLALVGIAQPAQATTNLTALNPGITINTFTECLNDGVALVTGQNPIDQYGWQYTIDSAHDGVDGLQVGGNAYEIYSLALKETADDIVVALNANMPLTGVDGTPADDGNIGWGDLFFNFSGQDFSSASNAGDLFAVRFAETNDSLVPNIGLYGDVTATSTTAINSGFSSIEAYNQHVATYGCNGPGCDPSLGDLAADSTYFEQNQSLNAIASGTYLTGLSFLSTAELSATGYDANQFAGEHTIAFKFSKSSICDRGFCQASEVTKSVPEPSGIFGLGIIGLVTATGLRLRRR